MTLDPILKCGILFLALAVITGILGAIGLLTPTLVYCLGFGSLGYLSLLIGLILKKTSQSFLWYQEQTNFSKLMLLVITAFILARYGQALIPQHHGDPLYYHLPSAWLWAQHQKIDFIDWLPWSLQGGSAEYVYTLLAGLLKNREYLLIATQVLHWTFGGLFSAILVYRIARKIDISTDLSLIATLAFLTIPDESMMLVRAKNDGFVLFFILMSLDQIFSFYKTHAFKTVLWSIFFASAAFSIKTTAIFYILPAAIIVVSDLLYSIVFLKNKTQLDLKCPTVYAITLILLSLGLFILVPMRNYIFTGNPMFPAMNEFFQSPYMNQLLEREIYKYSYKSGSWPEKIYENFQRFVLCKPLFIQGALAIFSSVKSVRFLTKISLLSLILFILITGRGQAARFGFFLNATLALSAVGFIQELINKIENKTWLHKSFILVAFLLVLPNSSIEIPFTSTYLRTWPFLKSGQSYKEYWMTNSPMYRTHTWMNENLVPGKVFSFYYNESYFLNMPLSVAENEKRAAEVVLATNFEDVLLKLQTHGFHYLQIPSAVGFDYLPQLTRNSRFPQMFPLLYQADGYSIYKVP